MESEADMIANQWYAVLPSRTVKNGQILGVKRLGQELAFFRTQDGQIACVSEHCSHRGAAISGGKVIGNCACCPFHGLRFSTNGQCKLAPSLGKETKENLARFNIKFFYTKEAHGIIYLWHGKAAPDKEPAFLPDEIGDGVVYSEIKDHWNAFYSRCIENQLDVLHLPFVHYNTIGRGDKTIVNGPKVIVENTSICTSAQNEKDVGQSPKQAKECIIKPTYLKFVFPNLWVNHIANNMKVMIFFAPVDDENTVLYVRFYSSVSKIKLVNRLIAFIGKFANRAIERQDKVVVVTQMPKKSQYRSQENLFPGDAPVIQYRRLRQELIDKAENASSIQML